MLKSFENSVQGAAGLGFNFDIVIVVIDLTNINVQENSKLTIEVEFNSSNIEVTSSRINVSEFKPGRSFEFNERPSILKDKLLKNPLECHVYYNKQYIGTSTFFWPEHYVNCIAEGCGREITRCDEADVLKENQKVGRIEIITRLQIKCHEYEEKQILQPKLNLCSPDDRLLNPKDVMFVVSETKYGSISCSDIDVIPASESRSSTHGTCLDLSQFRQVHGKTISNTNILDSLNPKCCKKKDLTKQYDEMIKDLLDKSKVSPSYTKSSANQQLCQPSRQQQIKSVDCMSESRLASCSSTDSCRPHHCISDEDASEGKSTTSVKENPPKRYCPLCHDNITWLPRFAACPKCGFRPIEYKVEEKPYDHTLTANKILQECINFNPYRKQQIDICQKQCRCTCTSGKICAHCRIKKLCEDTFQTTPNSKRDCGKCEAKSSDLYNICKTSSRNCRPYLVKVFQDLRDIFEMNETKKKTKTASRELNSTPNVFEDFHSSNSKVNQSKETLRKQIEIKNSRESQTHEKRIEQQIKKFSLKNSQKSGASKNKSFQYNERRKYPGTKIGHGSCYAGEKIVPRNMGWLWNAEVDRLRAGWVPGAIRKPIKMLMKHFLKKNSIHRRCNFQTRKNDDKNQNEEKYYINEPTLHICKKSGAYYITLRPLKSVEILNDCTETSMNMQPIQFKISKNPVLIEMRKLKQYLKGQGFSKCTCHKPISSCCCRSFLEKKKLEYQCCKECRKRELANCIDELILSDTTDSETEFEFGVTPPADAVKFDTCLKKRKKVSSATQYEEDDWKIKQEYPKPLGKYFKLHNCSIANRFGKEFGPYGTKGISAGALPIEGLYGTCGVISQHLPGKYYKAGKGTAVRGTEAFRGPDGKFNMALYLAYKNLKKPSPEELDDRKKQKMELLKGVNPPLLCKVDRRGKPVDTCSTYLPCLSDDRIC